MDFTLYCHGGSLIGTAGIGLIVFLFGAALAGGLVWASVRAFRNLLGPGRALSASRLVQWRSSRRWHAISCAPVESSLSEGAVVRLRGVVEANRARPAYLSGLPSVACQHTLGETGGGSITSGVTAMSFGLRLGDGTFVVVPAADACERHRLKLFDRKPHRWNEPSMRAWVCESRIVPGDQVEVVGRLQRTIDPSASRLGGRTPALQWTLHPVNDELPIFFETKVDSAEEVPDHSKPAFAHGVTGR
jgi:hypothetical protein